jgi:adenine-specific DNA-methyltransferase
MNEKVNKSVKIDIKERLKQVYPEVFEDNKVNLEKLKALLSGEVVEKEDDRFYFNWAGKGNLYKIIQAPVYGTLKPVREKSVDFDKTENIVIAGENLETLKLLLRPYFGQVKMIYIDPPYNTGKDFIYRDNFKEPLKDYLEKTGQVDSEGKKLTTNTEASGRYHSDWLNFIYPRLFLARSLLKDDGVIFISIDDNEVHNLRKIMDEIFGEENFAAQIVWQNLDTIKNDAKYFSDNHEYLICFARNKSDLKILGIKKSDKHRKYYKNYDNDPRGDYLLTPLHAKSGNESSIYTYIFSNGYKWQPPKGTFPRFSKRTLKKLEEDNRIYFSHDKGVPQKKTFWNEVSDRLKVTTFWNYQFAGSTRRSNEELASVLGKGMFSNPKPTSLIKIILDVFTINNDLVLDFFAGSGTTGHAVWDLNKEDGGNRKFILVQLDEEVHDEGIKKEFPTVADICIERLRRVSDKYKKEIASTEPLNDTGKQDFGFKVFRLSQSNYNLKEEFKFEPNENKEELKKKYLEYLGMFINQPLVSGWEEINVIYEVMLKEGLNLNSKIEKRKIKEDGFYYVRDEIQNLDFYISLEDKFTPDTIEEIRTSKYKGKLFVFLDNALTDSDKINLTAFVKLKVI